MFKQMQAPGWAVVIAILLAGCADMQVQQDPLLSQQLDCTAMHRYYDPMIANGAAYDMSVADIHFFPHSNHLNDLGVRRLDRLRAALEGHGGTVRYETRSTDEDGNAARVEEITHYLVDSGLDMTHVEVAAMMSGGRGMAAMEALEARTKARASGRTGSGGPPRPPTSR